MELSWKSDENKKVVWGKGLGFRELSFRLKGVTNKPKAKKAEQQLPFL